MSYKNIVIVNEHNEVIGSENLITAIEQNLLRRVVRIFVVNEQGQFLLQKRSQYVFKPGLYDTSAGGHVDDGETYDEAALRELREELGITTELPPPLITNWRDGYAFCYIYVVHTTTNQPINFDAHEIESVTWKTPTEILTLMENEPQCCAPALLSTWNQLQRATKS